VNFSFIPSPEKAKEFTAVEDACALKITLKIGKCKEMGPGSIFGPISTEKLQRDERAPLNSSP